MWVSTAPEVGLGGEVELVVDAAGAVGAQPHLGGRLLAGDVERAALVAGGLRRDLEQQRALADAGLAREQDRGAGHQAAAEHPVELGHAAGAGRPTPRPTPAPIGTAGRVTGRRGRARAGAPRPRRPSPRPGTRRSGRPTWRSPSRTRCSGRSARGAASAWPEPRRAADTASHGVRVAAVTRRDPVGTIQSCGIWT